MEHALDDTAPAGWVRYVVMSGGRLLGWLERRGERAEWWLAVRPDEEEGRVPVGRARTARAAAELLG